MARLPTPRTGTWTSGRQTTIDARSSVNCSTPPTAMATSEIDTDHDNRIDFAEFLAWWEER